MSFRLGACHIFTGRTKNDVVLSKRTGGAGFHGQFGFRRTSGLPRHEMVVDAVVTSSADGTSCCISRRLYPKDARYWSRVNLEFVDQQACREHAWTVVICRGSVFCAFQRPYIGVAELRASAGRRSTARLKSHSNWNSNIDLTIN